MTGTAGGRGEVVLRIVGHRLPGARWCGADGAGYERVHVGVQRGREPEQLVLADAAEAVFTLPVRLAVRPDGTRDFRGPYVQGRPGDRFVYLTWGDVPADGEFAMFRRAKLRLADIPADVLAAAVAGPGVLTARLALSGADGSPRCAAVRPPAVAWTVAPAG